MKLIFHTSPLLIRCSPNSSSIQFSAHISILGFLARILLQINLLAQISIPVKVISNRSSRSKHYPHRLDPLSLTQSSSALIPDPISNTRSDRISSTADAGSELVAVPPPPPQPLRRSVLLRDYVCPQVTAPNQLHSSSPGSAKVKGRNAF